MTGLARVRPSELPGARTALPSWLDAGAPVALFLDYDGTLTPIVARPEDALLAPAMRAAVTALVDRCASVVLVSGRDRTVVEELVGIPGLGYVGSHGFDVAGPPRAGGTCARLEVGATHLAELDAAKGELAVALADIPGAQVERKRFSIAAHFRRVAEPLRDRVVAAVDAALARHRTLRRAEGNAVLELRPDLDWDKGRAVLWLLEQLRLESATALHLGDDLTDETVFAALAVRRSGIGAGILVGNPDRDTAATHRLSDPAEVELFLRDLAAGLDRR